MKNDVVIYTPDKSYKNGYFSILKELTIEIINNRWLIYQLFNRDFSSMYKQSVIGILWIFILPIINVGAFFMLSQSGIFNVGEISAPYPIYAILGMAFWQIFSSGLVTCGSSLTNAGDMLNRVSFSRKSLVFASMGRPIVSFLIQFILVFMLCIFYKLLPSAGALLLPVVVIPILFLTLGLGFIVAILNAVIRDIGNLLYIFLMLLMYLTPVLYAKPTTGILSIITHYNPMYYFISAGRDLFLIGSIQEYHGFIISSTIAIGLFLFSIILFHLTETRIAERI